MADTVEIDGVTSDAYDAELSAAIDIIRAKMPGLDLRAGTAIRSLVLEPVAVLTAALRGSIDDLKTSMSIRAMEQSGSVSAEAASAVLSNFGIDMSDGSSASGQVRVVVSSPADVVVYSGTEFSDDTGHVFAASATVRASLDPVGSESRLIPAEDGTYYFVVPASASDTGSEFNIPAGTHLSIGIQPSGYVDSSAFEDFSGGGGSESISSAVARIPSSLAYRGLTNTFSTEAHIRNRFSDSLEIKGVSLTGYRDRAQLRDKHNAYGVSVGGRSDVYVRTFSCPQVVTFTAHGTKDGDSYIVEIPEEYAGFYAVKSVSRAEYGDQQGSLRHRLVRSAIGVDGTWHDILTDSDSNEVAWSVWQRGSIVVTDSSSVQVQNPSDDFNVSLYYAPGVADIQSYLDSADVRNVVADYVVRTPPICLVSVVATVRRKSGSAVTSSSLESAVTDYINSRSFTGSITRSEIANILLQHGCASVDLGADGMQLSGRVNGADGEWYSLSGDVLDSSAIGGTRTMLAGNTVVFGAEPGAVSITVV